MKQKHATSAKKTKTRNRETAKKRQETDRSEAEEDGSPGLTISDKERTGVDLREMKQFKMTIQLNKGGNDINIAEDWVFIKKMI